MIKIPNTLEPYPDQVQDGQQHITPGLGKGDRFPAQSRVLPCLGPGFAPCVRGE